MALYSQGSEVICGLNPRPEDVALLYAPWKGAGSAPS